jgi:MHS family citrate/tricarballylate:H+ symporter-like MFS transporter
MTDSAEHNAKRVVGPTDLKRRHVAAATLGNALEFYDFLTYSFFSIQIGHAFFPTHNAYASLMLSLAMFGAGFITRPIGAFVLGGYSDRVGRRPAMILSFALIGCSIMGMALIPTYATIGLAAPILAIAARMIQGFSLGGEVGSNTAFLLEAAPTHRRAMVVSWQGASQSIALATGALVGLALTRILPPAALDAYGWRIAFLLGAVTLPFGLWLRTSLPETLHVPEPLAPAAESTRARAARKNWRVIALGLVVLGSGTIASYIFVYITTYAQNTLHMPVRDTFAVGVVGNILAVFSVLGGGWLSDRIGRRPVCIAANLAFLLLIYPVFYWIGATRSQGVLIAGIAVLNIAASLASGVFYTALSESLPKQIRGGGFAIVYAVSIATFGGTTQLVVTWLLHVTGNPLAPAWYLIGATAIGQIAYLLMRETSPVRLTASAPLTAAAAVELG